MSAKKILLKGPLLSRSGYGEQTRFALRALRAHQDRFDIYLENLNWGQTGWIWEDTEERRWIDELFKKSSIHHHNGGGYDLTLQVTIPNEWQKIAPYNIGYTAGIETNKIAPEWVAKSNDMDKIIVVSTHAKEGFDNTSYEATNNETGEKIPNYRCMTPVEVVNYPVLKVEPEPVELDLKTDFNFVTILQWSPRKNLENTIQNFVEEFKNDQDVGLIVKVNHRNNSVGDFYRSKTSLRNLMKPFEQAKCSVYLLHGDMTTEQLTGLYTHPKVMALINLSHGEGYGLPMFEAAYNALPVIAPAWSGQKDFLYAPKKGKSKKAHMAPHFAPVEYSIQPIQQEAHWPGVLNPDQMWCFPHNGSYKNALRNMRKDYGTYKSLAKKLKVYVEKNFTEEKMYQKFADAVFKEESFEISDWLDTLNVQEHG